MVELVKKKLAISYAVTSSPQHCLKREGDEIKSILDCIRKSNMIKPQVSIYFVMDCWPELDGFLGK